MSDRPSPPLDPQAAADRNLELAGDLLLSQLDDPALEQGAERLLGRVRRRHTALRQAPSGLRATFLTSALVERVPAGATLVLISDDDPALAEHNLALARRVFATGRNVYLYHVRAATPATS